MWRQRITALARHSGQHVIFRGGEAYGIDLIIASLAEQGRTAWVWLEPPDTIDEVSLGNTLASAVNRCVGSVFLPMALPYPYHLEVLKAHPMMLEGMTLAVSRAGSAPKFCESLLRLPTTQCRVILDWQGATPAELERVTVISPAELALTQEEAVAESAELSPEAATVLWRATGGAFLEFQKGLHQITGRGRPQLPTALGGTYRPLGEEGLAEPSVFLDVLLSQQRYIEALDVACRMLPHRVSEVVPVAGPVYQERGLNQRLFLLLRSLDDVYLTDEATLEWLLVGAVDSGHAESALPFVEAHLAQHDAPQLRARYVGVIPDPGHQRREAQKLAQQHPTSLSLFQWGRLHPDPEEGAVILHEAVRLAERERRPYDAVRNAGTLAERLAHKGEFKASFNWSEWALRKFDLHGLQDGRRRLLLINNWAYMRIIDGQLTGLRDELWRYQQQLEGVLPELALLYRSTLAELELVLGHADTATELARSNVWQSSRRWVGEHAVTLVRALLERDQVPEALKEATLAHDVSSAEATSRASLLAVGMALAFSSPKRAQPYLEAVMNDPLTPAEHRCTAALHYLLAADQPFSRLPEDTQRLFRDVTRSGLLAFSGPEHHFKPIWRQVLKDEAPLRINVLGREEVTLNGVSVPLTPYLLEILTLIAFFPQGLTPQQLHAHLHPEAADKLASVKMNISRLRKLVPISSAPYRINIDYQLDAVELETRLMQQQLRQALALHPGPLLRNSVIPFIVERRQYLADLLHEAVLDSGDSEALFSLAQQAHDLELWEAAVPVLEQNKDPRLAVAKAMVRRLRNELGI
jgi:hypothetical protein